LREYLKQQSNLFYALLGAIISVLIAVYAGPDIGNAWTLAGKSIGTFILYIVIIYLLKKLFSFGVIRKEQNNKIRIKAKMFDEQKNNPYSISQLYVCLKKIHKSLSEDARMIELSNEFENKFFDVISYFYAESNLYIKTAFNKNTERFETLNSHPYEFTIYGSENALLGTANIKTDSDEDVIILEVINHSLFSEIEERCNAIQDEVENYSHKISMARFLQNTSIPDASRKQIVGLIDNLINKIEEVISNGRQ
jgi:hypothetical protein